MGDVEVTRGHLFRALVWIHVLIIGIPFAEFVFRGLTRGHEGFESLGWITYLLAGTGASVLSLLAAIGIVVPLILADVALGYVVASEAPWPLTLIGFGFVLAAGIGAALQWVVIREHRGARTIDTR